MCPVSCSRSFNVHVPSLKIGAGDITYHTIVFGHLVGAGDNPLRQSSDTNRMNVTCDNSLVALSDRVAASLLLP